MFDTEKQVVSPKIYEPVIKLPGKNVMVINTNHGKEGEPFPGIDATNKEIKKIFGGKLNALVMDSQPSSSSFPHILDQLETHDKNDDDFFQWTLRRAKDEGAVLVAADPYNYSRSWNAALKIWVNRTTDFDEQAHNTNFLISKAKEPERQREIIKIEQRRRVLGGLMMLLGFSHGVFSQQSFSEPISRRKFISTWLGFVSGTYLCSEAWGSVDWQRKKYETDTTNSYNTRLWLDNLLSSPHEMTLDDFNSSYFANRKDSNEQYGESIPFRNALAAEIIESTPVESLRATDSKDDVVNIATVWGVDHLMLQEQDRISSLLLNPDYRRLVIKNGLKSIFDNVRKSGLGQPHIDLLRTDLMDLPKIHRISVNNRTSSLRVGVPALLEILSDL